VGVCMCGFCKVWVCLCVGFVKFGSVYKWVLLCVGLYMCGFFNLWVNVGLEFVRCGCLYVLVL